MQNPDGHWKNEEHTSNMRRKNMDWDDLARKLIKVVNIFSHDGRYKDKQPSFNEELKQILKEQLKEFSNLPYNMMQGDEVVRNMKKDFSQYTLDLINRNEVSKKLDLKYPSGRARRVR